MKTRIVSNCICLIFPIEACFFLIQAERHVLSLYRESYTLVNLRLGFLYGNWDVYAFARNLTDDKYIEAFKSNPMLGGGAEFVDPRTVGVGLSYSF